MEYTGKKRKEKKNPTNIKSRRSKINKGQEQRGFSEDFRRANWPERLKQGQRRFAKKTETVTSRR